MKKNPQRTDIYKSPVRLRQLDAYDSNLKLLVREWLEWKATGCNEITIQSYSDSIRTFLRWYSRYEVPDLDPYEWFKAMSRLMQKYIDDMSRNGYGAYSINRNATHLSSFFRWGLRTGHFPLNPFSGVIKPRIQHRPRLVMTDEEYRRAKESTLGTMAHWLLVLGYNTGMSIIDACMLRRNQIDMEQCVIRLIRSKTKRNQSVKPCVIPFFAGGDLCQGIQHMLEQKSGDWPGDEYVCPEAARMYMGCQHNVSMYFKRSLERAGVHGKSFITMRRTFISNVANSGMNLALACHMTGHKNPAMFNIYLVPDLDGLRNGMKLSQQWAERMNPSRKLNAPPQIDPLPKPAPEPPATQPDGLEGFCLHAAQLSD